MRAPLAPRRFRFWCAVWACVLGLPLGCAPPFLTGLSVYIFCTFFFWFGFVVSVAGCPRPGPCGPCPPIPFLSGWAAGAFFFRGVCLHVLVSTFLVGRCSWLGVASFGWVVPLCLFGGPVFGAFWMGGLVASCGVGGRFGGCGLFSRPPPFFFRGGGVLPVPPSAFPLLAHALARIQCGLPGCCWLLRSAGWAAAPGGCVWLLFRRLGLFVSFLLCGAGFNLLGGPPPLLPGERWPRVWPAVPVCGVLVRRLPGACFG